MFWFSLQRLSEKFLVLRRTERDSIINVHRSSCKVPVTFCKTLMRLEYSRQIFENCSSIKFLKTNSSGKLFHTDRQRDMTKLIVAFRSFAKAPKNKTGNVLILQHWGAFVQQLLQWKSSKNYILRVCVCIWSLSYPAWNAHVPYCHLWPVRLYDIFPHSH